MRERYSVYYEHRPQGKSRTGRKSIKIGTAGGFELVGTFLCCPHLINKNGGVRQPAMCLKISGLLDQTSDPSYL